MNTLPEHGSLIKVREHHRQQNLGAPEELEFLRGAKTKPDMTLIYPTDPSQLPKELAVVEWPPKG